MSTVSPNILLSVEVGGKNGPCSTPVPSPSGSAPTSAKSSHDGGGGSGIAQFDDEQFASALDNIKN